jgi:hypothetical protein
MRKRTGIGGAIVLAVGIFFLTPPFVRWVNSTPPTGESVRFVEWNRGRSTIALLFIHGLGGCAVPNGIEPSNFCPPGTGDSFRYSASSRSWAEIVAADQTSFDDQALAQIFPTSLRMSDFGVFGIDYSRLTTQNCPKMNLPDVANLISEQIQTSRLFDRYEQVIIVSHSMGGLITKIMLMDWRSRGDRKGLLNGTIGIFLVGVPSQGSNVAPDPGVNRYVMETFSADWWSNVCSKQVRDLFAGDQNTYLRDLERRWETVLGAVRVENKSQAPLTYCAYETVDEPIFFGLLNREIVGQSYTNTQCSDRSTGIGTYHTRLPKPDGPNSDVHKWLRGRLDSLISQWISWPFMQYDVVPTDTFEKIARYINQHQRAFVVEAAPSVKELKVNLGHFDAPNAYVFMRKIALANPMVCTTSEWPESGQGLVSIKAVGECKIP